MKRLLITGSTGFIGNYFINKYKNKYDIKSFSFRKGDIDILDCNNTDIVFHLSALVHQVGGASDQEYKKVNVTQTLDLAKKAKENSVKHFIFMSTVAVYGLEIGIIKEDIECNPITDYGKSKLKAEKELKKLENDNFKISIVRTPIVNGYNAPGNMNSLINLVNKVPIIPFWKIENKRSMVYIGNLCNLVDEVIKQEKSGVFLASDDEPLCTSQLIKLISENLDKKIYLIKIPFFETLLKLLKPSFHKRLYGSLEVENSATKEKLNLKNLYSVEEGIKYMIKGEKA